MPGINSLDCSKGPTRIIPAVPLKYERSSAKSICKDNSPIPSKKASQSTSHLSGNVTPTTERHTPITPSTQDYGIEKHGKLPPPFYPATSSPARTSTSSGSALLEQRTTSESGQIQEPVTTPLEQLECSKWGAPDTAYPTPPDEDPSTSFHFSSDAKPFHPQPTPPSDVTPSPVHSLYQHDPSTRSISFYPPETPEYIDPPSSAHSLYPHYSYEPIPFQNALPVQQNTSIGYTGTSEVLANGSTSNSQLTTPAQYKLPADSASQSVTDSDHPDTEPEQAFSRTSVDPSDLKGSNGNDKPMDDATCDVEPAGIKKCTEAKTDYGLWRRMALHDLQAVSDQVWHSQMMMPSFFLQHFNDPRYADCRVHITKNNRPVSGTGLLLHSVLLTYSPTLAHTLESTEPASDGLRSIVLAANDGFLTPYAIECALHTCYGWPLAIFIGTNTVNTAPESYAKESVTWMKNALAFIAAGQLLTLPAVIARGLQIATRILNWDNIAKALAFVIAELTRHGLLSTECISTLLRATPGRTEDIASLPYSDAQPLLVVCLRMLQESISKDWILNRSAPSLHSIDRLPSISPEPQAGPKSRLNHIQFGSLASEQSQETPNPKTQDAMLSSIMLCLPFALVGYLISKVQDEVTEECLRSLVNEREHRRQALLREAVQGPDLEESNPLGWEEYLETVTEDESTKCFISRRWTGLSTSTTNHA